MKRPLVLVFMIVALAFTASSQTKNTPGSNDKPEEQPPPPSASANPSSVDFKDQVARKTCKPQRVTITNTGGKGLYINSAVIDGDNKEDFTIVSDTCTGATIGVNKSCTIDIALTPAVPERRIATLVITDNAKDSPQKVPLIGNGINSSAVRPGGR
jgi:centrosomal CEP192-like protein